VHAPAQTESPAIAPLASEARRGAGVGLLSWSHFLNDGAANYLPGILPAVLVSLAIPLRYAGALVAILVVGQALQVLAGALADRFGGRAFLVLGLLGSSLGAACVGWTRGPVGLLAALVLIGIANSAFHPPAMSGARRAGSGTGERAMAVFSTAGEIGRGVWPLLASLVVTAWGLGSLWVLTLAAFVTLPLLWKKTRDAPAHRTQVRAWQGVKDAGRPLQALVAYSSMRSVVITGVSTFVPLWWEAHGGNLETGAALITVMLLVGVVGNLGAGFLAARIGRRGLVIGGTALGCALLIAMLKSQGIWIWVSIAGLGIALFATLPITVVMGQDLLPRHPSLGSGLALGFSNALGALGVGALGLLAARWGAAGVLWGIEACGLVAIALAALLPAAT